MVALLAAVALAAPPQPLPPAEVDALTKSVRAVLVKNLPDPLAQSAPGWGQQKDVTVGVKFRREGIKLVSEPQKGPRNDGTWRRTTVRVPDPDRGLGFTLSDVVSPEPGRLTLTAGVVANCDFRFEQQVWKAGARLYSGETRGRVRVAVALKCEATNRLEKKPGSLVPDVVVRVRATEAQLFYEDLVIEHTAGVGGDAAKLLGETAIKAVKLAKPHLEADLLAKANAAIVKAGDTKEVRIGFPGGR